MKNKFDWHSDQLTLSTPIDNNYKNTQNVRRFFTQHLGEDFHFNRTYMAWFKNNIGATLQDAIDEYKNCNN